MSGRVKFQVWSPVLQQWRTAYARPESVQANTNNFVRFGFIVRLNGRHGQHYYEQAAA